MSHPKTSDWNDGVCYNFEKFDPQGFANIVENGYRVYHNGKARYDAALVAEIDNVAAWSQASGKPLITTECWAVVDYKDWPSLEWGWVKDLTAMGVAHAAAHRSGVDGQEVTMDDEQRKGIEELLHGLHILLSPRLQQRVAVEKPLLDAHLGQLRLE